jgi:hypothetical protein
MRRYRRIVLLVVGVVAVSGVLAFWFRGVEPIQSNSRWYTRVRGDIMQLAHKRPPEVSKVQWECVVGWTINLHGNCGGINSAVDPAWRDGFADELERRLQGPITLADIEWIWDEYARHTTFGQTYSERWQPTRLEQSPDAVEMCCGLHVDCGPHVD